MSPMSVDAQLSSGNAQRYEALVRLFGSLASRGLEDLARNLASELRSVLDFDFPDVLIFNAFPGIGSTNSV